MTRSMMKFTVLVAGLAWSAAAQAGQVEIVEATATPSGESAWRFDVTLEHADEGWDHYADLWVVETPEGTVLGERVLLHPHVDEQPFTRSLSVEIPEGVDAVTVRARDSVHGWAPEGVRVELER